MSAADEPMLPVMRLFCLSLGFTVARTMPPLVSFYAWFRESGLKMAEHRGYGQSACKAYGIIPAPKLSVMMTALSGALFLLLLVVPCLPLTPSSWRAPMLGLALVPYHLYFSQLYCEAHVGAHVTVLIPPALILLALSPALDGGSSDSAEATAAFTCWMMKIVITSAYCGAGVSKITHSIQSMLRGGSSWFSGSTLQAFLFEAMFLSTERTHTSFGLPTPFSQAMQLLHFHFPRMMLAPASVGSVAFETFAPLLLLAPAHLASVPFALSGLAFHYGIALLQNIDFVSWWGPAYAFLLADPAAWAGGGLFACPVDATSVSIGASVVAAYEAAPWRASLAMAYVGAHLLAVLVLRFFPDVEILPFSAFPMFSNPHNLFDGRVRKWVWLTDKPHATGTIKNYAFPFCRQHTVQASELHLLPFKYLLFGHNGTSAADDGAIKDEAGPVKLYSNIEVSSELQSSLDTMRRLGAQQIDTFAIDPTASTELLAALADAKRAFASCPRASEPLTEPDTTPCAADVMCGAPSVAAPVVSKSPAAAAPESKARPIVLFDGVCLLCSTFIHFVLDHDLEGRFDFAPLQGETGTKLLTAAGLPLDVSTMVLIDEEGVHVRSTAALRVLAGCGKPWSLLHSVLIWLPAPLRDTGYKMVASMRYRLFGMDDGTQCRLMTKSLRARFHK